jgi:3'-5' exoribonuclease
MIGHLVMETIMVADYIKQIPDFPDDLRRHLLHLLLTHHGKLEYGSPKLPSTPEALMLSYLDDLDSKVEAMLRLIAEPQVDGDWTRISPMFERPIYRRRTIETPAPAETTADDNQAKAATAVSAQSEKSEHAQRKQTGRPDSFNTPFEQLSDLFKGADQK